MFQFYLSSIKSRMEAAGFNPYNSFNSTLVQLKVTDPLYVDIAIFSFNSTLVQLKDPWKKKKKKMR